MELRRLSICFAFFVLAVVSQCSEARHSVHRRASDFSGEEVMNDGTADYPGDDNEVNEDGDEADQPVTIVSKPENFSVRVGSSVRLECKFSPATQYEIVQWTKGDDEGLFFNRNPTYKSELRNKYELYPGTQDLIIKDVNVNDTDRYTCKILQTDPVSVTHRLIVTVPPMIESTETTTVENVDDSILDDVDDKQPRIVSFMVSDNAPLEGSQVVFTCKATGVPKPSIIWARRRNGEQATENLAEANGEFHDQTFFMRNVTKDDSGVYFCYAINDAGNATAQTVTLTVYGKPRIHAHKTVINSDIDVEAVLKCSTHDGPHEISWFKDGRRIHSDTSANFKVEQDDYTSESTLTVIPKTNEDFGTFTCEASNRYGSHSKSIKLTNRPIIEGVDFEGGKLTFTVHSHQPLLKIEAFLQGEESKTSFEIPVPETESKHTREVIYVFDETLRGKYEMTLRAENTNGWGDATDAIFVNADLEAQPQIKTAQVLGVGSGTHSVLKSPSFFLNTIMMYLLVRTLL